jgi:Zn-dependent peptidase ImmA (M78 family)
MSTLRVSVSPSVLQWAIDSSGRRLEELAGKQGLKHLPDWLAGSKAPTYKQLKAFAHATWTALGYLFLKEPPADQGLPIPDFRTVGSSPVHRISPHLRDTIYLCQRRQFWFQEYAQSLELDPLPFVGSARVGDDVIRTAEGIRQALGFDLAVREQMTTWEQALRDLIRRVEAAGVLIMVSGVVGNDTTRPLNPQEFRGFVLVDGVAPVVFVNGADSKSAQMFTIAHELAHVWLGREGLLDGEASQLPDDRAEAWCNRVAAEVLVPLDAVRAALRQAEPVEAAMQRVASRFKVSTLVALRRLFDAGFMGRDPFEAAWRSEVSRLAALRRRAKEGSEGGGNFYASLALRVGERFAQALISSAEAGETFQREALGLLAVKKTRTMDEFGRRLGVMS